MRSHESRDDHAPIEGMTRLHIDVCNSTFDAIADFARQKGIDNTEALCRRVYYSELVTTISDIAAASGEKKFMVSLSDEDGWLLSIQRRNPDRRHWWHFFLPRYITERVLFDRDDHHNDNRLVVETP